jgi:hypothetical protein
MKQSSKTNTVKVTTPTTKLPITAIQQITEDASAWPTVDGVKQKNGLAYADGSTLVNTSGDYDDFNTANGSLVLPNGPYRTVEYDLTFSSTPAGWSAPDAVGVAYSDSAGNWRLVFNIFASITSATSANVTIDGISLPFLQGLSNTENDGNTPGRAYITGAGIITRQTDVSDNNFIISGDIALASAPTWAAANLESYPVVALFDNAGANVLGIPKTKYQRNLLSGDISSTNTDIASLKFSNLTVGNTYRVFYQGYLDTSGSETGADYVLIDIYHDGVRKGGASSYRNGTQDEQRSATHSTEAIFVATTTTVNFRATIGGSGKMLIANDYSYTIIEELPRHEITTEF